MSPKPNSKRKPEGNDRPAVIKRKKKNSAQNYEEIIEDSIPDDSDMNEQFRRAIEMCKVANAFPGATFRRFLELRDAPRAATILLEYHTHSRERFPTGNLNRLTTTTKSERTEEVAVIDFVLDMVESIDTKAYPIAAVRRVCRGLADDTQRWFTRMDRHSNWLEESSGQDKSGGDPMLRSCKERFTRMLASESVTPLVCVFAQGFRIKLDSPEHVDMACDLLYRLVNIGAAADIVSLLEQFPNLNDKIDFGRIALGTLRTYDMNAVSSYLSKSPKRQKRFFAVVEDDVKEKLFQLEDSLDNASWISSEQSFELKMHSKHISKLIMKWKWGFSDYPSIDLGTKISSALWLIRGLCISAVNRPSGDGSDFNDDRVGLLARDFVESRCGLIEMLLDDITSSSGKTLLGKIIMFVLLSHIETRSTSTYFVQKLAAKGVDNADWTARLETIIIPREFSSSAIFTSDDSAEEGIAEGNNNALQKKKQSNSAHLRKEDTEVQKTLREAISHYPIYALTDPVTLIDNPSQLEYTKIKAIFESSEQAIVGMDCEWVPDILARHANIMAGPTAEDDHTQEKVDETASTTENGSLDDLAHGKKRKRKGNVDHPRSTPPAIMQLGVSTGDSKHIYILDLLSLSALEVQALLVPLLTNKSMLKLAFDFSNDLVKLRSVYESIPPNVENLIDLSKKINHQQTPRTTSEFVAPKLFAHGSRISLAQVVVHYLKMRMDKSVRLSDWSKRPLANAQVRYGATDVAVLLDAYEVMRKSKESQDC